VLLADFAIPSRSSSGGSVIGMLEHINWPARNGLERGPSFPLAVERNNPYAPFVNRKNTMTKDRGDLLQGTLDMLVLKALQLEPMHGWGITERIEHWSEHVLQLGQGTLYPALYRLERQGFIRSEWKVTENSRRARYYSLMRPGRQHLEAELAQWRRTSRAVNLVLDVTTPYGSEP